MCNQVTVFLKKICVSERKCVTLHLISAKGRKFFKIAKSLLTFKVLQLCQKLKAK